MAWARIDDNFFNHPKVRKAGKDAVMFHVAALCHSNAFTTDGFIAFDMLELIATQAFQRRADGYADRLVECDLWERVEGGYQIHDFLKYNHSKTEVEEIRTKKSAAGKQGGRPAKPEDKPNGKQTESKPKANDEAEIKVIESHTQPIYLKQQQPQLARNAFSLYSDGIGHLNAHMADVIKLAIEEFTDEWVVAAIESAIEQNTCKWSYVDAILKRWKIDGFKVDTRQPKISRRNGNGSRNRKPDMGSYEVDRSGETVVVDDGTEVDGELQF